MGDTLDLAVPIRPRTEPLPFDPTLTMGDAVTDRTNIQPNPLQSLEPRMLLSASELLPLGDQITYGTGALNGAGYRGRLEDLAEQFGDNFGYTGTQDNLPGEGNYTSITDREHFGLPGVTAATLESALRNNNGGGGGSAFDVMANAGESPDSVFLHVGTNAITTVNSQANAEATALDSLVTYVRGQITPADELYLAQIIPNGDRFDASLELGRRQATAYARYNFNGTNSVATVAASNTNTTLVNLWTINANQLETVTDAELAQIDVDGDNFVDWYLDYDEANPQNTANLDGITGYNSALLNGSTPTPLAYKVIAEVLYQTLAANGDTTGFDVNDNVSITGISTNRLDTTGGRQVRLTAAEFQNADGDDIWAGDAAIRDNGTARANLREGLYANVTLENTANSSQNFDVNFVAYDPTGVGRTVDSFNLSLGANQTTTYVLPVYSDVNTPSQGRWLGFFTVDGQPIDFNADLFIEVDNTEVAAPNGASIDSLSGLDFGNTTVPANQQSRVNAYNAVLNEIATATGVNVGSYQHDILAGEASAAERFAVTAQSQIDVAQGVGSGNVSVQYRSRSIAAEPGNGATNFTSKFDAAKVVVKVEFAGSAPTFANLPSGASVVNGGAGVRYLVWDNFEVNEGFTPDSFVNESFTITSSGSYDVTGYVAMTYGPYRDVPGSGNDAMIVDYSEFVNDPDDVHYLAGAADASTRTTVTGGGMGGITADAVPFVDFNGDGNTDIVWRNQGSTAAAGRTVIWLMDGETRIGVQESIRLNPVWELSGVADFNLDGNLDFWWRNTSTGRNTVWLLDENQELDNAVIVAERGTEWRPVGFGDFNQDGVTDVYWARDNGQQQVWNLGGANNLQLQSASAANDRLNPSVFTPTAIADWDQDGAPDVIYRRTGTVLARAQLLGGANGVTEQSVVNLPGRSPAYHIAAIGDYDGNGTNDILWRREDIGFTQVWTFRTNSTDTSDPQDYDIRRTNRTGSDWQNPGAGIWYP